MPETKHIQTISEVRAYLADRERDLARRKAISAKCRHKYARNIRRWLASCPTCGFIVFRERRR